MNLDDDELELLTKKKHRDAQVRVLVAAGIKHIVRPDGSIIVSRAHVEHILGGMPPAKVRTPTEPDWGAHAQAQKPRKQIAA